MILPSEVTSMLPKSGVERESLMLERLFDDAIAYSNVFGVWPARVAKRRRGMTSPEAVELVVNKYRDAGWLVDTTNRLYRAVIDAPNRPVCECCDQRANQLYPVVTAPSKGVVVNVCWECAR